MSIKKISKIFKTFSAKQTQDLAGQILADLIKKSAKNQALVLALQGNLGSGKTTFTQGLAKFLKIKGKITSPTFVILKRFKNFYHIDAYRLSKPEEILGLGWEAIISNPRNIVAVEWPEKIKKLLPKNTYFLKFRFIDETKREITCSFITAKHKEKGR